MWGSNHILHLEKETKGKIFVISSAFQKKKDKKKIRIKNLKKH